ncbi:MAG TPA: diacylglycerol kinase [Fimbriimonadaceae bacterium]|nr:diacylglycerol kinase [Fimbriimonadaceae bacterium]
MSQVRKNDILGPVKVALQGLVYTFRTQRHMRFHLYVVLIVTLLGILFNMRLREMLILLFVISLVLVAEMFNSAIEATVDLVQPSYHPLAKFAKDIAAGAVLITTIIALDVGALILLGEPRWEEIKVSLTADTLGTPILARFILGALLLFVVVIVGKGLGKRGQVLKGGLVSGHAAYGFFIATAIMFITDQPVISGLGMLLAAIIAQSRWEAKIHSVFELSLGAAVGVLMGLVMFGVVPK